MLNNDGYNVEDIDAFSQTDEAEDELVSLVDILHLLPEAAGHVEEPHQGSEGVVHQAGEHSHSDQARHHKTFLLIKMSPSNKTKRSLNAAADIQTKIVL